MRTFRRVDKRIARKLFNDGEEIAFDLNAPTVPINQTVVWSYDTTTVVRGVETFDEIVADCEPWQHRYPGSRGLCYYVVVE